MEQQACGSDANLRIHANDANMNDIYYPELSYKLVGLCFKVHKELGRFCREKQYADKFEQLLKNTDVNYAREFEIINLKPDSPKGNKVDFLIEKKIILDTKAKNFITKEDYFQMQRYLRGANFKLGLIVNFRSAHLKPKRVLNSEYDNRAYSNSQNSHKLASLASNSYHSDRSGYIALITVLITGAIGVAIATSLLLLGLGSSRTSFALEQSNQAKSLANACSEGALQQIRDSTPFTGTGNLTLGQGSCNYIVTSGGGQNRTIASTGTVGSIVRKVKITIDNINPSINVTSWQEVADF